MDVLFITPDSSVQAYQKLAVKFSAIEPPTWSLLLAESCRSVGFSVSILDCDAERLSLEKSVERIKEIDPRLIVFVLYGQNPNSGTTSMIGAEILADAIKASGVPIPICLVGSHVSALPKEVLKIPSVDIILLNEGVYALRNLLESDLDSELCKVKGIGYKIKEGNRIFLKLNEPEKVVPQDRMDIDLPGYAWDLLPFNEKPLDLYRAHFWHTNFNHTDRSPFAAIYTSLGCQFACNFCMINILNRTNNSDNIDASHSKGMRFWSPNWVRRQMDELALLGVKTLRLSDEMFFLNRKYYVPILDNCIERNYGFNMWTYSRIDTVRTDMLEKFKVAGVNWLALGVEAGSQFVRQEISKGKFKEINIREVCKTIQDNNINIISNYILGFPDDDWSTMRETVDLALELNTEMTNVYPCQALPGSPLHNQAVSNGWDLPASYEAYAFLSYECQPLRTKHLSSSEVLRYRDEAWSKCFTNPAYLSLVEQKFGIKQRKNVEELTTIKLKRKLLGD